MRNRLGEPITTQRWRKNTTVRGGGGLMGAAAAKEAGRSLRSARRHTQPAAHQLTDVSATIY